jgi:ribosome recycling factor
MSPVIDGAVIRLNLPALTEERRRELVKVVNTKHEEAKGTIRRVREEVLKVFKDQKTAGTMPEDEFFMVQKDLQKLVDEVNAQAKSLAEDKEKEVMTI